MGLGGFGGGDFRGRLGRQVEPEAFEQQLQLRLGLGVSGQAQFATVGGRDVHVNHLNSREFLEQAARGQTRRQSLQAKADGDVQAISQERDEDMRLDTLRVLMMDRPDGEIALQVSERLLDIP